MLLPISQHLHQQNDPNWCSKGCQTWKCAPQTPNPSHHQNFKIFNAEQNILAALIRHDLLYSINASYSLLIAFIYDHCGDAEIFKRDFHLITLIVCVSKHMLCKILMKILSTRNDGKRWNIQLCCCCFCMLKQVANISGVIIKIKYLIECDKNHIL